MLIRYLADVHHPPFARGKSGDVLEVNDDDALRLIGSGHALLDGDPLPLPPPVPPTPSRFEPPEPSALVRVRYVKDVTSPESLYGIAGDVRELDAGHALRLIGTGHAVHDGEPDPPQTLGPPQAPRLLPPAQTPLVRVRYLNDVSSPEILAGSAGQEREIEQPHAVRLAGERYVEIVSIEETPQ